MQAAKLLGKGEPATLSPFDVSTGNEQPEKYYARINALRDAGLDIRPANESNFDLSRQDLSRDNANSHQVLGRIIGGNATGQMLQEALDAYQKAIQLEYKDSSDGLLTDNGKTKIDQIKTIKTYLPDQDLGLLDYTGCDQVFGIFRRRPISKRYGKPMSRKSCSNNIGELGRFFRWLHLSPAYRWRKPEDFDLISRTPRELDEDVEHESADTPVWTIVQLKILNEKPIQQQMVVLGSMSLGGNIIPVENLAESLQVAFDSRAKRILLPMASARDIPTIPGELFAKFQTGFYADPVDAVFKALGVQ